MKPVRPGHLGTYSDTRLRIRRGCSCGRDLDIETRPPDRALRTERDWLIRHAGHQPRPPGGPR